MIDFRAYLGFLRSQWEWIAIATTSGIILAMIISMFTTPKFASTAELFLATPGYSSVGSIATSDTSPFQADVFSQQRARSYVELAGRYELAERVIEKLQVELRPEELAGNVSARVRPDTVLIEVTVKALSPRDARTLANAAAAELAEEIKRLETPAGMRVSNVDPVITQPAEVPERPREPNLVIYAVLGAVFGFLFGITGLVLLRGRRTVDSAAVILEATGLPVLGEVRGRQGWPGLALRVTRDLGDERPVTIAVVTVGPAAAGCAAADLAAAIAQTANCTVLVAIGDVAQSQGWIADGGVGDADHGTGLAAVVSGDSSLIEALRDGPMPNLKALAGPAPSNLEPLLATAGFRRAVDEMRELFDISIFDAPDWLARRDVAVLAGSVDHVLLVALHGRTRRQDLIAAASELAAHGLSVLGVMLLAGVRSSDADRIFNRFVSLGRGTT